MCVCVMSKDRESGKIVLFVGHAYQPHLQLLLPHPHTRAKRSQRESAEYRDGETQAMASVCHSL